ncbi:MAG: hypothetical protein Q8M08_16950 [Bacteroidales bacterium]|nr:hypothetical protein [Bacteroidales bacterium]
MKEIIIIIIATLFSFNAFCQTEYFDIVKTKEFKLEYKILDLDIIHSFSFENLILVVGHSNDGNEENVGLRLFILNDSSDILFKSKGQQDSYYFEPQIFQSRADSSRLIILSEIGAEYSWGAQIFLIDKNKINHLGYLDVGIIEKPSPDEKINFNEPSRIIKYISITAQNDEIKFSFKHGETLAINPGGENERRIKSDKIYFIYKNNKILEIEKTGCNTQ